MTTTHTTAAFVAINGEAHRVLDTTALRGEDDGLVAVLVKNIEHPALYWTTVLAEDVHVHPVATVALTGALLWDATKHG